MFPFLTNILFEGTSICFKGSEFTIVNTLFFSSIKLLLSIKKKNYLKEPNGLAISGSSTRPSPSFWAIQSTH